MSRWQNNGGWNKSHGTVEKVPRIDSYEAGAVEGYGSLFGYAGNHIRLALDCTRYTVYGPETEQETVEVWHPKEGWSETLTLSRNTNSRLKDLIENSACCARLRCALHVVPSHAKMILNHLNEF